MNSCLVALIMLSSFANASAFECTGGDNSAQIEVKTDAGEPSGLITLEMNKGPLQGEHSGECFTPDPPHVYTQTWPFLKCTINLPENSGFSLYVFGDGSGLEKIEGSSWKDGQILPGKIELNDCE